MKEIQSIALVNMNNAADVVKLLIEAGRAEKDAAVAEKCKAQVAALREAVKFGKRKFGKNTKLEEEILL